LSIAPFETSHQSFEVLRECQLREADLVIDLEPARADRGLDRTIHAGVRDVVSECVRHERVEREENDEGKENARAAD
jgi:hypothetical protein